MDETPRITVTLPWPYPGLSPNERYHWRPKAEAFAAYKNACAWEAKAQGLRVSRAKGEMPIVVTFRPKTRRAPDRDNAIGAFKAGQDGLALALGIDDSRFVPTYRMGEPVKGGAVVVELSYPTPSPAALTQDSGQESWQSIGSIAGRLVERAGK